MNIEKYYKNRQLVLASSLYDKKYEDCIWKEKNTINSKIKNNIRNIACVPSIIKTVCEEERLKIKELIIEVLLTKTHKMSGERSSYFWFASNKLNEYHDKIYNLTYFLDINVILSQRIHHIVNEIWSKPICKNPDCVNDVIFLDYTRGYRKFCSIKCSKNPTQLKKNGFIKENTPKDESKIEYYKAVRRATYNSYKKYKYIINPDNLKIGLNGSGDVYQLDHIIPIIEGYNRNINPNIIGHRKNLQMLHWVENRSKDQSYCKDYLEELLIHCSKLQRLVSPLNRHTT